jgi:U3 small nucleolar RNA-associated protein 14
MLPEVPHGFDNRVQYERTISMPLGKEWNSVKAHSSFIAPKIKIKRGSVIHPLKFQSLNTSRKQPKVSI